MHRSYAVRLKVTKRQEKSLNSLLGELCELYNAALQERRDAWKVCRKRISYFDQTKELKELRFLVEESRQYPACIQRDPLKRVKRAFDAYFNRLNSGNKVGYPRFKSKLQYNSFDVDSQNFRITGNTIGVVKLGTFRFKTRCKFRGIPKQLQIQRKGAHWIASIVCYIGEAFEKVAVNTSIGIDLGLTHLVNLSNGLQVVNPRWAKQEEDKLATANRNLSRKVKGSKNRAKAKEVYRKIHQRIAGKRRDFLHQISQELINEYDLIAYEKLNIAGMSHSRFGKSIMDAAWGELIRMLTYKAESAGKWIIPVNPRNTSKDCSNCGKEVPKKLWQRWHDCPHCGYVNTRDWNAALNILDRGMRSVDGSLQEVAI